MLKPIPLMIISLGLSATPYNSHAHTEVVVNLNVKHSVNGAETFVRESHIGLHSTLNEKDWVGEEDKLAYMMNELDVYFGRDNGIGAFNFRQADQDPGKPGFADPDHIIERGNQYKQNSWNGESSFAQQYDGRGEIMIGGQPHPHYFGETNPFDGGPVWTADAQAVGEYFGQFMSVFFRADGEPVSAGHKRPAYFEVLNEPLYELTDDPDEGEDPVPPIDIFTYHNEVAQGFRKHNTDVKIGGYVAAFPIFEDRNFARWDERMKLFMDTSGELMDFWSVHFYDLENDNRFKGSRIEATLDMIDHYSFLKFGDVKEYVISEYGGRNRPMEKKPWTPLRDWWFLKTASPMLVQFLDRPDTIVKSLPFVPTKAEWGRLSETVPYTWRLLRQEKEAPGETGEDWVFTDMVKFYQLWSDVKGTRVESFSTNNDVLLESYVDKNTVYVVVSNLVETPEQVLVQQYGMNGANLQQVKVKHLYLDDSAPVLNEQILASDTGVLNLQPEATMVLEYTYDTDITQQSTAKERKYFASDFLQQITANVVVTTTINGVDVPAFADVKLRIAVGRDQGQSLSPLVTVNNVLVNSQLELMGDSQPARDRFFGLLEFDVPFTALQESNAISVTFADGGGHVASVNMKVLEVNASARPDAGPVEGVLISAEQSIIATNATTQVSASVYPFFATNKNLTFSSTNDAIASVDSDGVVTGLAVGKVKITATSEDGSFSDAVTITVEEPTTISLQFDDKSNYLNTVYMTGDTLDVTMLYDAGTGNTVSGAFGGIDYFFRHLTSSFTVINDIKAQDGSAIGNQRGTSTVSIPLDGVTPSNELQNGEFYFLFVRFKNSAGEVKSINAFPIQVAPSDAVLEPSLTFDDTSDYLDTIFSTDETLDVSVVFEAGDDQTVSDTLQGVKFFLRELRADFTSVNDVVVYDESAVGQQNGTAKASIPLTGLTPSSKLPDGHFYYLFAIFESTDGNRYSVDGIFPISVEQSMVEPSFGFSDGEQLKAKEHIVGQSLDVTVDFEMGTEKTVSNGVGGIRYLLRELRPGFVVVKDVIVEDPTVIGQQSGTSSVSIPLADVTPTTELPEGHFYFLFALIESSDGSRQNQAVFPLNIVSLTGDFDGDGDVDLSDIQGFFTAISTGANVDNDFDLNGDGAKNIFDVYVMYSLCTQVGCAI